MKIKDIITSSFKTLFTSKKSYSGLFRSSLGFGSGQFDGKTQYDYLKYNEISLYVNRAVEKRAEKVSEIQFVLKKGDKIIDRNPILDLLNKPNKFHTGKQFWKLYQKHLDITGNAFIYLETSSELFEAKKVIAMHLLRPDLITIVFNEDGSGIQEYIYKKPDGTEKTFTKEQVLYAFEPDPVSLLRGASLLTAGVRAIETEIQLAEYQAKILKNGGKVDGVFKFKTASMTKDQVKDVKASYKEQRAELSDYDNNLFLGGDTDYVQLGMNPQELSYLESKKVTLDDISILTGVPRSILAVSSGETYSNADASIAIFLRETIKPLLANLTAMLDWRYVPEEFDLDYIDPTPEDIDRKIKILEAAHNVNALTINEKREMLGLEPYKNSGADEILVPFSMMPLGSDSSRDSEVKKKSIENFNHPLRDVSTRKLYGDLMVKRMDRGEAKLLLEMRKYFDDQYERVFEQVVDMGVFKTKGFLDNVFNSALEIKIARNTLLPIIENILTESGKNAFKFLESAYKFTVTADIGTWLDKRADLFAREITQTTFNKLQKQFEDSFTNGESRQDLIKRIKDTYDGFADGRAKVIARTEVHGATTKGTFEGYRQAGAPIKIWVTVGDKDVRDSHSHVDGEERPINMDFSNGLSYPGDPDGRAEDTINCRCVI